MNAFFSPIRAEFYPISARDIAPFYPNFAMGAFYPNSAHRRLFSEFCVSTPFLRILLRFLRILP